MYCFISDFLNQIDALLRTSQLPVDDGGQLPPPQDTRATGEKRPHSTNSSNNGGGRASSLSSPSASSGYSNAMEEMRVKMARMEEESQANKLRLVALEQALQKSNQISVEVEVLPGDAITDHIPEFKGLTFKIPLSRREHVFLLAVALEDHKDKRITERLVRP